MTTSSQLSMEAAKELLIRRKARTGILDYANAIEVPGRPIGDDPDTEFFQPIETTMAAHHRLLLEKLEVVSNTPHGRMMVFMPPGSAKSTYASVVFPSKYLGEKPNRKLILASYGDDLARKMGRRTRSIIKQTRYAGVWNCGITAESSAAQEFSLTNGSEYMACGILGGVTGNRANGIIIDDPIKGREQANSPTVRAKTWDAYEDDLKTRLIPGGWIVLIQTRWHENDLAGRILPDNWNGESGKIICKDGNEWEVLCLQARCEVKNDPLGRKEGEYLWTEWFDRKHWAQFEQNARTWAALYQQRPRPIGGDIIKGEWFKRYKVLPRLKYRKIFADTAQKTAEHNDYSVFECWGLGEDGRIYLLDLLRGKWEAPELKRRALAFWAKHKALDAENFAAPLRQMLVEDKASGTGLIQDIKQTGSIPIAGIQRNTDKFSRVMDVVSYIEAGLVYISESEPWVNDFVAECEAFTPNDTHAHDDQIDPMCDAINDMLVKKKSIYDVL